MKTRIIFPQDRDIQEDVDELKERILSAITDKSDGNKLVTINYGSTHHVMCRLRNGELNGVVQCYTIDHEKISYIQYIGNKKYGLYTKFHLNGLVAVAGTYKDDIAFGVWNFYDENGELIDKIKY